MLMSLMPSAASTAFARGGPDVAQPASCNTSNNDNINKHHNTSKNNDNDHNNNDNNDNDNNIDDNNDNNDSDNSNNK